MELYATMLGGAISLIASVVTIIVTHRLELSREKKAIAGAFRGEVASILKIIETRRYLEDAELMISSIRQNKEISLFHLRISQDYFEVFSANCSKLGLLGPAVACDIAIFYTYAKSLVEDLANDTYSVSNYAEALVVLEHLVALLKQLKGCGESIVANLR